MAKVKVRFAFTGSCIWQCLYHSKRLFTRQKGGTFLLRMDDTDDGGLALAEQIKVDLTWLGLTWDEYAVQSQRLIAMQRQRTRW